MTITDPRLYEIRAEMLTILDAVERDGGELTDEQAVRLKELDLPLDVRVDGTVGYIRRLEAVAAGRQAVADRIQAEADAHKAKVRAVKNKIEWLKGNLNAELSALGVRAHKTATFSVWQQASQSAECLVEPETLPERFRRTKVEADRKAALDEFKATGQVPDGFTIRHGSSLRIG
jgi:hypothetical protein